MSETTRQMLHLTGTQETILDALMRDHPELHRVLNRVRDRVLHIKREISEFQAGALYALAKHYNHKDARILEIGTAYGYSAAVMAEAAPLARIITLNPKEHERMAAMEHLKPYPNVQCVNAISWEYLAANPEATFDMVFVDGDHARISKDMPWWDRLRSGGLFFHHDYSPEDSWRPCPPVYDELNRFCAALKRGFDVLIVDDGKAGMAGWYKD